MDTSHSEEDIDREGEVRRMRYEHLDRARLRAIQRGSIFIGLPSAKESTLSILPRTYSHYRPFKKFIWSISADADALHCSREELYDIRAGYLRAALSEFASFDNAVEEDAKGRGVTKAASTRRTTHPGIHLARELRHLEMHLTPSRLSQRTRTFRVRLGDEEFEHESDILVIDDLTVERVRELRNASSFHAEDLAAAVSWFADQQDAWGVTQVLETLCEEFVDEVFQSLQLPESSTSPRNKGLHLTG